MYISIAVIGRNRIPMTYVFDQSEITLGRSSRNDIVFDPLLDGAVSRTHAVIRRDDNGRFILEDMESTQGTYVNNHKIEEAVTLSSRDSIVLGIEGPRIHVSFESEKDNTTESRELVRSPLAAHFPLALYRDFPRRFSAFSKIGEGGYGQVWRGKLRDEEGWLAVKFLRPELLIAGSASSSVVRIGKLADRFQREAELTRLLSQSGATGVIGVHEVGGDPANGAGVDTTTCEPHGAGFDTLCTVWRDPDFDPRQPAFYYARVVENPTCRWTQKLCSARGVRCDDPATVTEGLAGCCAPDHRPVIQERAWTSPLWYTPAAGEAARADSSEPGGDS